MEQLEASSKHYNANQPRGENAPLAVEAQAFAFVYPQAQASIGPLDWQVEQGSFQLLVGATGSGKTTLMRCLKPAIAPVGKREGVLSAFGIPAEALTDLEAAATIGYVSQSPENQIVCDTVWHEIAFGLENLGMPQATMRRRVAEVAHFFGIEPWFRRVVDELSGGQKQIVTLASVLALQPRLLLLDEPTAQLDPVAEKNFLHALFRVNRELGITVVVATHTPEAMTSYATNAVELANGQLQPVPLAQFSAQPLRLIPSTPSAILSNQQGSASSQEATSPNQQATADNQEVASINQEVMTSTQLAFISSQEAALISQEATSPNQHVTAANQPATSPNQHVAAANQEATASNQPATSPNQQATSSKATVISLSDAYARYSRGGDWILRGCDLAISRGHIHALVGGNGSGKSTLLRLVAGVMRAERGRVTNKLTQNQALLPQDPKALFVCDTVMEELQEWQQSSGYSVQAIQETLQRFNLVGQAQQHPYDLSGGQQQKLALAKLLLTSPDLLLLDEPTKGLDTPSKMVIAKQLVALAEDGVTILLATHDLTFSALLAHRVTMLFDGEATCTEPASDFFASNLFYRPTEDAFARAWQATVTPQDKAISSEGSERKDSASAAGSDSDAAGACPSDAARTCNSRVACTPTSAPDAARTSACGLGTTHASAFDPRNVRICAPDSVTTRTCTSGEKGTHNSDSSTGCAT